MPDCLIRHGCGHGIHISGRSPVGSGPTISGCTVSDCAWSGISVAEKDSVARLENHTCRSNKKHGIVFWRGATGTVEANHCVENGDSGIFLEGEGTSAQVISNVCSDNQRYGICFRVMVIDRVQSATNFLRL